MRFVDPQNDVAFKKIFGNEEHKEILISFLNAVLDLQGDKEIADVELLNPYQAPKLQGLKFTLLDIRARDKRGVTFIVEMQVESVVGFKKRFLYYACKAYSGQIGRGDDYPRLNQVIFIGILNFIGFEDEEAYISRHLILNQKTHKQEIEDLELCFIELPKFNKHEDALTTLLDKWVYFLKHAAHLTEVPAHTDDPALQTAYEVAERFRWSDEELEVYDYWSMKAQDERGALTMAEQRGEQRGRQETARAMLADGLPLEMIIKYTELSAEQVRELPHND